jgi:hypothetical protein
MMTTISCDCVDAFEDECDLCSRTICFGCDLATPSNLPFIYCKDCFEKLDSKDPTMNIPFLRLLKGEPKDELLAEVGYEKFFKLVDLAEHYEIIGDELFRIFSDRVR